MKEWSCLPFRKVLRVICQRISVCIGRIHPLACVCACLPILQTIRIWSQKSRYSWKRLGIVASKLGPVEELKF